ncbi:MAG: serine/threonine-protein kinase [Planctomycetota bacterium]
MTGAPREIVTRLPATWDAGGEGADRDAQRRLYDLTRHHYRRRLRILTLIAIAGFALGSVLTLVIPQLISRDEGTNWPILWLCIGMVLVSTLLWRGSLWVPDRWIPLVAHVYIVLSTLAMSITEVIVIPPRHDDISGVSGICIWIVLFPMIIASRPRPTAVTAVICASLLPLCYLAMVPGNPYPAGRLLEWFVPGYFCAGLAYLSSLSVGTISAQLEAARARIRELSGYRLERCLAVGGMGEVWLARHRLLPMQAAIKLIRTDKRAGPDDHLTQRFRAEARAVAALRSPHIVRIYDYGIADDGALFFAMEYVPGIDLTQLMRREGRLQLVRARRILVQICYALEELHGAGLLHRDIKPDNVLLCRIAGQTDVVKLIDLGLAVELKDAPDNELAGTPGYLAPELVVGDGRASPASDLYGLGCIAWYLVAGEELFGGVDEAQRLIAHVADPVPELPRTLPNDLIDLIRNMVAKNPAARPASARAVRLRLQALALSTDWDDAAAEVWWDTTGRRLMHLRDAVQAASPPPTA